ncbi:VOC family protein [Aquimarina sp. U1-2]|uniref:VOC family protein n=1 Tax=Aquimarina sp. U1-2 TaxID=2823141 RepID=UPI001AED021D|nr:VOC family protein [Aquimarina sp. U1-2]MBP2833759.1 VOC family protein [Aquimarina sp. U1-2]
MMRINVIFWFLWAHGCIAAQSNLEFYPQQLVITVPDVNAAAAWYVENLDFVPGKSFTIEEASIKGRLVRKGEFEMMLLSSKRLNDLPDYRKTTMSDLSVAGVKRIAFRVEDMDEFSKKLRSRGVSFETDPVIFTDKASGVKFKWCIIKDLNENLIEFMEWMD